MSEEAASFLEEQIPDDDLLSRFLIYPHSYEVNSNIIAYEGFIEFPSADGYADSLVWRRYASNDNDVHLHGVNAALAKKERLVERGRMDPGILYKGFLSAHAGEIRAIESASVRLDVKHVPEEGQHHAEVYCVPASSKKIGLSIRSDLKLKLYRLMAQNVVPKSVTV